MKLVTKLRGFKNYSDLKATLTNRRGNQVIDSISKTGNFNGRFAFRFERGELPGKLRHKRASLKITIESLNKKSEANFLKGDEEFSFAPQRQVQRFRLFKDKKNSSRRFFVQGRMINQDQDDGKQRAIEYLT